ncbi:hypothetical protein D3C87_1368280 [compost metagenome]
MAQAQGFDPVAPCGRVVASALLGARQLCAHVGHGARAQGRFGVGQHGLDPRDGRVEIVPVHAHLAARALGEAPHLVRGRGGPACLPCGQQHQPIEGRLSLHGVAAAQLPAHAQRQGMAERAVQPVAHPVVFEALEVVERVQMASLEPAGAAQHQQTARHGIGNRGPQQQLQARLQQVADSIEVVALVQHIGQQRRHQADHAELGRALLLRGLQHAAQLGFRFGHPPLEGEAQRTQALTQEEAPGVAALGAFFEHGVGLRVLAVTHVHPGQQVAVPGDGMRVGIVGNGLQRRHDGAQRGAVVLLHRQAAAQQRDAVAFARAERAEVGLQLHQLVPQFLGA